MKFKFSFYNTLFCAFFFFILIFFLLNRYICLLLTQKIISWFIFPIHLELIQLHFYFFLQAMVCLIQNLKCQILFKHLLQYLYKYILFLHKQWSCIHPYTKFLHFHHIFVLHSHTKVHTLQFLLRSILINLNKQAYSKTFEFFSYLLLINFLWKTL